MKILIVDDNKKITSIVMDYAQSYNYEMDEVNNSKEIDYDSLGQYNLIMLDVEMPQEDGFSVIKKIKSVEPSIPVIFLSGMVDKQNRMLGLELGAEDYILKPIDMDELFLKINNILRRNGRVQYGDFLVDKFDHKVSFKNEEITITTKAYDVLIMLLENINTPVSKEEIMNVVWEEENFIYERSVDVQINFIRKELGSNSHVIKTVRKIGYMYEYNN